MDRCRHAELQASPNDGSAQCLDLEPTGVSEVSGHRRSPLRRQRRGLPDGAIRRVDWKRNPLAERNGRDLLASGGQEQTTLGGREKRTNTRAGERRHPTDTGDEQELLPQHAIDVGRDLVRNVALLECLGDPPNAFGHGPAGLAEDDLAFAAGAKDHAGAGELQRDVDRAGSTAPEPTTEPIASTLSTPFWRVTTAVSRAISGASA
jgi:hypothetical protein